MNKAEIRDLYCGEYWNEEMDCALSIYKTDKGVHIVNADIESDWCYHWIINENGEVEHFKVSSAVLFDGKTNE